MKRLFILIIPFLFTSNIYAQVRGWNPGELFVTTEWYWYELEGPHYRMVLFTEDNGKTFEIKYLYDELSNDLKIYGVWADKTPDVLYGRTNRGLYRTVDNCLTWIFIEDIYLAGYSSGTVEGEIYRKKGGTLYFSNDYANEFEEINDSLIGQQKVGTSSGEVYIIGTFSEIPLETTLSYSNNYGATFETWQVDTSISGYNIEQNYPTITAGTEPGELYFISFIYPGHYRIFRSLDYGHSFTLQSVQADTIYGEQFSFTAGREPGSFYVVVKEPWFDGFNTRMTIYYSSDYAQSFTKYIHILDPDWTGTAIREIKNEKLEIKNYPNPFKSTTNIYFDLELLHHEPKVQIFNSSGQTIDIIKPVTDNIVEWNSTSKSPGIYYYRIITSISISKSKKMILIK